MGLSIGIGLYLSRRHNSAEDYFLAGRSMSWPFIGIYLFASNISSTTLVGLSGEAYAHGIAVFNYEWMAAVVLVTGVFLLGFYFWCTNQFMAQRVLSARNIDHGRWGILLTGLLKLPVLFLMVLPGSFAILLYPGLDNPDLVFPTLIFDLLTVQLHILYIAPILFAFSSLVMFGVSRVTAPPDAAHLQGYVWSPADYRRETIALADTPWWKHYRTLSLALLALTAALVAAFW